MAIWKIVDRDGRYVGRQNSGETAEQAIDLHYASVTSPVYCRFHKDLPVHQVRRQMETPDIISPMCWYTPKVDGSGWRAIPMREVYMGGGYCVVEAA